MLASISPAKAREMAESGQARLVDIRETSEFSQEHVPGARLVPLSVARSYAVKDGDAPKKPVIYLYPEEETDVKVKLDYKGDLTCTYPKYENGWEVTALPDGTLKDKDGMEYNYLYWEGQLTADWDRSKGFCVKGEDTERFLEYFN